MRAGGADRLAVLDVRAARRRAHRGERGVVEARVAAGLLQIDALDPARHVDDEMHVGGARFAAAARHRRIVGLHERALQRRHVPGRADVHRLARGAGSGGRGGSRRRRRGGRRCRFGRGGGDGCRRRRGGERLRRRASSLGHGRGLGLRLHARGGLRRCRLRDRFGRDLLRDRRGREQLRGDRADFDRFCRRRVAREPGRRQQNRVRSQHGGRSGDDTGIHTWGNRPDAGWSGIRGLHVSVKGRDRAFGTAGGAASLAENQQRDAHGGSKSDQQFHTGSWAGEPLACADAGLLTDRTRMRPWPRVDALGAGQAALRS
ncbi:protein of unknown function [Burkholderia multivorans]